MKRTVAIVFLLLFMFAVFPVEALLQANMEKEATIAKWQEEKAPFTLRESLKKQEEKRAEGTLKEEEEIRWVDGEILVVVQRGYTLVNGPYTEKNFPELEIEAFSDLTESYMSKQQERGKEEDPFYQILSISLKDKTAETTLATCEQLLLREDIYVAHPNYIYVSKSAPAPTDPESIEETNNKRSVTAADDETSSNLVSYEAVFAQQAWNITKGSAAVTVAVIDSGVRNHRDLAGALLAGYDTRHENSVTTDVFSEHGTHVAGIIAARENNTDIIGIAPNVRIYPIQYTYKTLENRIRYDTQDVIEVFNKLGSESIPIANWSEWLNFDSEEGRVAVEDAINNYCNAGGLLVCAAGNNGEDVDSENNVRYPAWFNHENIICVANLNAFSSDMSLASDSNYGESRVDIAAPGVNILSTIQDANGQDTVGFMSGTSMASPMVAGTAALLLSEDPTLTAQEIKQRILETATPSDALADKVACGGYLNIGRALTFNPSPVYKIRPSNPILDSFGLMTEWENRSGVDWDSYADVFSGNNRLNFNTMTLFPSSQTNSQTYHYRRLRSSLNHKNQLGKNGDYGVTIDLALKLDMLPIQRLPTSTPKYGQTGFVVNVHMSNTKKEFYFCIAKINTALGTRVAVTYFNGNRTSLDSIVPQTVVLNLPDISEDFHQFTLAYSPRENKTHLYVDGEHQADFNGIMTRSNPTLGADMVAISLVNRKELTGAAQGNGFIYAYSEVELASFNIYNVALNEATIPRFEAPAESRSAQDSELNFDLSSASDLTKEEVLFVLEERRRLLLGLTESDAPLSDEAVTA